MVDSTSSPPDDPTRVLRFASKSGSVVVRSDRLPILETVHEGELDDETFAAYLRAYGQAIESAGDYGVLVDVSRAGVSRARQRTMQAEMLRAHADTIARHCIGAAFVADSVVVRASLYVVFWLQRIRYPYVVVATRGEAERWLEARLAVARAAQGPGTSKSA